MNKKPKWKIVANRILPNRFKWKIKQFVEKYIAKFLRLFGRDIDFFYGEYFATDEFRDKKWVEGFSEIIVKNFSPKSIIDFGCGTGDILVPFEAKNIEVLGVDGSKACLKYSKINKENFVVFDLRERFQTKRKYDLCFSLLLFI